MPNNDTTAARAYHESTKLAYINLANKPPLYKTYRGLPTIPLPADFPIPQTPTLTAVSSAAPAGGTEPDLPALAQLLYHAAGVTRTAHFRIAGEVHFRAAASAGGLYPVETYLACRDLPGLPAGIYHFSPADFALTQLRQGDQRADLANAAGRYSPITAAPVTLILTTVFWRSSWKYRARAYRYCLWDNGTVAANLLATATAASLPAQIVNACLDHQLHNLLDIDGVAEAATCLIPVGVDPNPAAIPALSEPLPPIAGTSVISAPGEIDYPEIRQIHAATMLTDPSEIAACRGGLTFPNLPTPEPFYPLPPAAASSAPLGQTIKERGSTRRFAPTSISRSNLASILHASTRGVPADFLNSPGSSLLNLYLIINAVDDIPPGAYYYSPQRPGLSLLKPGDFRQQAGHLGFEQALPADASAVAFFTADLARILEKYGNRGYRAAQLEAGILGGKLYLSAHSLGLGASGLTFYDDAVTHFFSPHAAGQSPMFVIPIGKTAAQNRVRPFRSRIAVTLDAQSRGARPS